MTRSAPKRRSASPETPSHSPPMHRRPMMNKDGPRKAFSKTTLYRPKSPSPTRSDHGRLKGDNRCESPYDTPNPRSKAPKPVAYNTSGIETKDPSRTHFTANGHKSKHLLVYMSHYLRELFVEIVILQFIDNLYIFPFDLLHTIISNVKQLV